MLEVDLGDPRLEDVDRYEIQCASMTGAAFGHEELIRKLSTLAFLDAIPFFVYVDVLMAAQSEDEGWLVPTEDEIKALLLQHGEAREPGSLPDRAQSPTALNGIEEGLVRLFVGPADKDSEKREARIREAVRSDGCGKHSTPISGETLKFAEELGIDIRGLRS